MGDARVLAGTRLTRRPPPFLLRTSGKRVEEGWPSLVVEDLGHDRHADRQDTPERSRRLRASIQPPSASTKPRQMAGPSPVPARRRSLRLDPVEFVEDVLQVYLGGTPGPSSTISISIEFAVAAGADVSSGCRAANIWRRRHRLNNTCSNSSGIEPQHRHILCRFSTATSIWCRASTFAARSQGHVPMISPTRGRSSFSSRSARLKPGQVEQGGEEAVSRSASASRSPANPRARPSPYISPRKLRRLDTAPRIEGKRSAQIVRDRGQQRLRAGVRSRPIPAPRSSPLGERDALDRDRRLVGERVEQTAPVRGQERPRRRRGRCRSPRPGRCRCATAETGACRRAACRRRARPAGCAPRSTAPPPCRRRRERSSGG